MKVLSSGVQKNSNYWGVAFTFGLVDGCFVRALRTVRIPHCTTCDRGLEDAKTYVVK